MNKKVEIVLKKDDKIISSLMEISKLSMILKL